MRRENQNKTKLRKKIKPDSLIVLGGVIILLGILYGAVLFGGYKLSFTNLQYSFLPFSSSNIETSGPLLSDPADNVFPIAYASIHKFIFSGWLPTLGIGAPQSMMLYLFFLNYLYLLPFEIAPLIISVTKIVIAFTSMYWLMKRWGYTRIGSFVSGSSFALCSTMIVWHGWPHSEVTMFAPLLFLIMDLLLERLKIGRIVAGSVVIFLMLVAGMPTYTAYFMYLLGCYVLYYGITRYWKEKGKLLKYFLSFALCVLLGAFLSLPYTAELLQTIGANGYSDSRKSQAALTLNWEYLRTLIFPYIRNDLTIHVNESTLYTGLFACITLPFTLFNKREKPKSLFFAISAVILTLLIFTNVFYPLFRLLPLINTSAKFRVIVLLNFCLAILLGMNIDDFIKNIEKYRIKKWLVLLLTVASIVIYSLGLITVSDYTLTDNLKTQVTQSKYLVALFFFGCFLVMVWKNYWVKKVVSWCLVLIVVVDVGTFGSYYLPLIEKSANVIPQATDSLKYLEENTTKQEKTVTIGDWTFFPSSNMFYDIRDIRGHNFVYTNEEMQQYYSAIDKSAYSTPTRITFDEIENENLLKYMGVKYIISNLDGKSDREPSVGGVAPSCEFYQGIELIQSFTASSNNLSSLQFLMGTYQTKFSSSQMIHMKIVEKETRVIKREVEVSLENLADNSYLAFSFDPITDSQDKEYELILTTNIEQPQKITFYASNEKNYEGIFSESKSNGNLVLLPFYAEANSRIGADGLVVSWFDEYSSQIQLTDKVVIKSSASEVLSEMENDYQSKVAYFSNEEDTPNILNSAPLSDDEKVTDIVNYDNGNMTFNASVDENRVILINEYNDGNWSAYVDGNEVEIYKGNYLFRGIVIPKGTHKVELKYNNSSMTKYFVIFIGTGIILLFSFLFRKKIDSRLKW